MDNSIRVLHVDDDAAFVDLATDCLQREDDRFEVVTATSASDGLARLAEEDIDCIISDYDMPGMDGIEFLRTVRKEYPDLPFVLFTGKGSEAVASEAISAGVTDYLQKGGGTDQYAILANRVQNYVERARADRRRQRHLDAIETAQEGISILDGDGHYIYVNEAYADLYGYEPEEMIGEHWELIYPDDEVRFIREEVLPAVDETGHWHGETTGLRADGSTFVEDHTLTTTADGELICTIRDVTERKERERRIEALHRATRRLLQAETKQKVAEITAEELKNTLDYPINGVRLVSDDGDRLRPTAYTTDARLTMGDRPVYSVDSTRAGEAYRRGEPVIIDDVREVDDEFDRGDTRSAVYLPLGPYGSVSIGDTSVGSFDQSDVQLASILTTNAEAVLNRVEQEQELRRQNERLEQFASIVSHDLRTPLNVADGKLELAREECNSAHLDAVKAALDRMDGMIDSLLTMTREGEIVEEVEAVDLASLAEGCWRTVATEDAELIVDTRATVFADEERLQHVFENLFRNAVEHGGPAVTVRVGTLDDEEGVYVADDGPGIPEVERGRVFEPGVSTAQEGMGLGLTIVKEIAEAHGWEISVTDSARGGAQFEISGVEVA